MKTPGPPGHVGGSHRPGDQGHRLTAWGDGGVDEACSDGCSEGQNMKPALMIASAGGLCSNSCFNLVHGVKKGSAVVSPSNVRNHEPKETKTSSCSFTVTPFWVVQMI